MSCIINIPSTCYIFNYTSKTSNSMLQPAVNPHLAKSSSYWSAQGQLWETAQKESSLTQKFFTLTQDFSYLKSLAMLKLLPTYKTEITGFQKDSKVDDNAKNLLLTECCYVGNNNNI